jgi:hypothetical protein
MAERTRRRSVFAWLQAHVEAVGDALGALQVSPRPVPVVVERRGRAAPRLPPAR